ncbi:516_t:CDS:2, partial [Racocetra persica]
MADAQETKLKYRRGTCFSCRKCLYCGIDLQQQRCNCNLSDVPHKDNRTAAVKYAFTRVFKPNWIKEQAKKSKAILGSTVTNADILSGFESYDLTIPDTNAIE